MSRKRTSANYIVLKEFADKPVLCDLEGHMDIGLLVHQQNWVHIIINVFIYLFVSTNLYIFNLTKRNTVYNFTMVAQLTV